ncbi:MAG: proteasome activator [Ilumatobacteraceae bacterium]
MLEECAGRFLDEASRERLAEIYERSIVELSEALSPDLRTSCATSSPCRSRTASPMPSSDREGAARRLARGPGLDGIQATLFAQQLAATSSSSRCGQLPPGATLATCRRGVARHVPVTHL